MPSDLSGFSTLMNLMILGGASVGGSFPYQMCYRKGVARKHSAAVWWMYVVQKQARTVKG